MCHCTCTRAIRHPPLTADINTYVGSHSLFYRFSTCEKEGSIPDGSFSFTCSSPSQSCQIGDRKKRRGVSLHFSGHFFLNLILLFSPAPWCAVRISPTAILILNIFFFYR